MNFISFSWKLSLPPPPPRLMRRSTKLNYSVDKYKVIRAFVHDLFNPSPSLWRFRIDIRADISFLRASHFVLSRFLRETKKRMLFSFSPSNFFPLHFPSSTLILFVTVLTLLQLFPIIIIIIISFNSIRNFVKFSPSLMGSSWNHFTSIILFGKRYLQTSKSNFNQRYEFF